MSNGTMDPKTGWPLVVCARCRTVYDHEAAVTKVAEGVTIKADQDIGGGTSVNATLYRFDGCPHCKSQQIEPPVEQGGPHPLVIMKAIQHGRSRLS